MPNLIKQLGDAFRPYSGGTFITEDEALTVHQAVSGNLLQPDEQEKANALLSFYQKQQVEAGRPLFPSLLRKQEQEKQQFRSLFDNPDNVTSLGPQVAPYLENSPNPQKDKMRIANVKFLSHYTGKPENEIWNNPSLLMSQFAQQTWKAKADDDASFYALAAQHVKKDTEQERMQDDANQHALLSAAKQGTTGAAALAEWKAKNPDADARASAAYLQQYNRFQDQLSGYQGVFSRVTQGLQNYMNGETDKNVPQETVDTLLNMPPAKRSLFIAAMLSDAQQRGDASDKGSWSKVPQETGEAFARTVQDMLGGSLVNEAVLDAAVSDFEKDNNTSRLNGAFDAGALARAYLNGGNVLLGPVKNDLPTEFQQPVRPLTPEETQAVRDNFTRVRTGLQLVRQVREIARTTDPVKSALASGLGSSAALVPLVMLPGGVVASAAGYANMEFDQMRLQHPEIQSGQARAISIASGSVQAVMDLAEADFMFHKLPSLGKFIDGGMASTLLKRGALRAGAGFAFEQAQEGAQDITTPFVQAIASHLSSDIPQVDWQKEWADWAGQRGDVAIGTLPLTLIGLGVGTHSDIRGAGKMMQNRDMLRQLGVTDEYAVPIADAAAAGDNEKAQELLRVGFQNRDVETAKAAGATPQVINNIEAEKHWQRLYEGGVMPKFDITDTGILVTTKSGETTQVKTWAEAKQLAEQHFADQQNADIDFASQLAEHFIQQPTGSQESVKFEDRPNTLSQDVADGFTSPEDARASALAAGAAEGLNEQQSLDVAWGVLGRNKVETEGLIKSSASALFQGANVLTVAEEVVEGRWKLGLADGTFTEAQARAWVAGVEAATGETFLHNNNLTEAISSIVIADVLGSRKDGTRVPAGLVTKGVAAAIARRAQGITDEKGKKLTGMRAFLAAWRQFFKATFSTAMKLKKAKTEGKLEGTSHQMFVDKLLGVNTEAAHTTAVAVEAANMAGVSTGTSHSLSRITPEQDADYMRAVESGDMETAQRMVDDAAKAAGYDTKLFHGRQDDKTILPTGSGLFLSSERVASDYGKPKPFWANLGGVASYDDFLYGEGGLQDTVTERVGNWTTKDVADYKAYADIHGLESGANALDQNARYLLQKNPDQTDVDGFWFLGKEVLSNIGADSVRREYTFGGGQPSGIDEFVVFNPNQIKSADPITRDANGKVIPLSVRFNTESNSISYSLTKPFVDHVNAELDKFMADPEQDADYMRAVEVGDMETAQRMVDEAAKMAMPDSVVHDPLYSSKEKRADKPMKRVYHGTDKQFDVFESGRPTADDWGFFGAIETERHGIFFAENKKFADTFAKAREGNRVVSVFLDIKNPFQFTDAQDILEAREFEGEMTPDWHMARWLMSLKHQWEAFDGREGIEFTNWLKSKGYDGAFIQEDGHGLVNQEDTQDVWVALSPSQIKSADPITRDANGKVIPLSERFNPQSNSISYSLTKPFVDHVNAELDKFMADPDKKLELHRIAKEKLREVSRIIESEAIIARGEVHRASETKNPEGTSYEVIHRAAQRIHDDTLARLKKKGDKNAESKAKAAATKFIKEQVTAHLVGKTGWTERAREFIRREAQSREAFEYDRLLREHFKADTAEKQAALPSADRAAARSEAKTFAKNWLEDELAKVPTSEQRHNDALRVLDAVVMTFDKSIRSDFGTYSQWHKATTPEARIKLLTKKLAKVEAAFEKMLREEYTTKINKLLQAGAAKYPSGEAPSSKVGADTAYLFKQALEASRMDEAQVLKRLDELDAMVVDPALTPEQQDTAAAEAALVEAVGNLKGADSARMDSALRALQDLYDQGKFAWSIEQQRIRAAREAIRTEFKADTGKTGNAVERSDARDYAETYLGMSRDVFLRLSSFSEVLHYILGRNSKLAIKLTNQEREASNAYHDANNALLAKIGEFFTGLAGGEVAGQKLQWEMKQRTIDAGPAGKLSQFEAVTALLMWAQEDGKRHMEGGPETSWHYDQAWVDDLGKKLTPEAQQWMNFASNEYAGEWATLNAAYRERFGVDLPQHDKYAPVSVKPHTVTSTGKIVDPVTGLEMHGSVTRPGFLRTRSSSSVSEPDFRDSLQTLVSHKAQMEYWLQFYDIAKTMEDLASNNEVRNHIEAQAGAEGLRVFSDWATLVAQGGFRDAGEAGVISKVMTKVLNNASSAAILGRLSTLLVQSSQLAAASVQMPLTAYLSRVARAAAGDLNLVDAWKSDFIQRRVATQPPIVRQAMATLMGSKPNLLRHTMVYGGKALSTADAVFTTFTYASILDYQREQGAKVGLAGAELEQYARSEAERLTEQVSQPVRSTQRSLYELQAKTPLARALFPFVSEARQKVALAAWATANADVDPLHAAKVYGLVFIANGLFTVALKNALRDAKGDDDQHKWDWDRMLLSAAIDPLSGIPGISAISNTGSLLSGPQRAKGAVKRLLTGDVHFDMKMLSDIELILQAAALGSEDAAALSALSHAGVDAAKLLDNLSK